jgi:hypothetical protein
MLTENPNLNQLTERMVFMSDYHEPVDELGARDRDYVRALNSLKEEVEAVNWYQQRVAVTSDEQLKAVLAHNRDEEIEHACMTLEWLRRNMPAWEEHMRTYLFKQADIVDLEEEAEGEEEGSSSSTDLGLGDLR